MHIKQITNQHRRDFYAVYACEHCKFERKGEGYDDSNFHQNVIPAMICPNCNKTASEGYQPRATKHDSGAIV